MNEDNQYPNQDGSPNQGPNPNFDGNTNTNQFGDLNQNQNVNQGQNQYVDQNQSVNQNHHTDQDKYWNPNQNQNQYGNQNQYQNQNQNMNQNNQYGNQQQQFGNTNQYGNQTPPKKPKSKKLAVSVISVIFALLLVGGGAFAFFNMQKSPKDQLLLAELNSWGQLSDVFESRYKPELEWAKKAETTPTENTYNIGASVEGDFYSYDEMMIAEMINNSSISLDIQLDPNKQLMKADLGAEINGVTIDDFSAFMTTKELMFGFPFTEDILQVNDGDFGNLMRSLDPYYEGEETLGLSDWMGKNMFSKENTDYLVKEYLLFFYNSIPAEAFTEATDNIDVFGKELQTNKITMDFSGDQIKEVLLKVLEKAKNDPKFEDIIIETLKSASGAAGTFEDDFDIDLKEGLEEAIEELKNEDIPFDIKYTAWVNSDTVVKSELEIDDFIVKGTRQFTNEKQQWDYTLEAAGEKVSFVGDLSYKNGEIDDEISLLDDNGTGLTYEGSEELDGGDRTFNRTLYINDGYEEFEFFWEGEASYKGDSMEAEHTFGMGSYEFDIAFTLDETGSFIKNVDIPTDNIVDIGSMTSDEIETYMMEEFLYEAQSWFMDLAFELGIY